MTATEDETQPLLRPVKDSRNDATHNPDLPENWSLLYRWSIVALLAFLAFTVTFTCLGVMPVASQIVRDLQNGQDNKRSTVLFVTIWELGEAAGPLFTAPLSEMYGRYKVYNCANVLFIVGITMTALSQSVEMLVFARFITGCAVAGNVLNPAIVGDLFSSESRGSAMSIIMLAPLLGGAIGPVIAGKIAETSGWRPIMWMALALAIACEIGFLTLFRETYEIVILKKQSKIITEIDGGDGADEMVVVEKKGSVFWTSIMRPAVVLHSSFILQILSLYSGFAFAFFYIMSTTLPDILREKYNMTPVQVGSSFLSFSVGSCIGIVICNTLLDRIYNKLKKPGDARSAPENRLPLVIVGACVLPFVIAFYGWAAELVLPVPLMLLAVVLLGFSIILPIVPLMAYVVDAFGLYSASSLTAVLISRCLMGTFLPLATAPLTDAIGYGWGFTVLAACCAVLAPIPLLVYRFGGIWRQRSEYTKDE